MLILVPKSLQAGCDYIKRNLLSLNNVIGVTTCRYTRISMPSFTGERVQTMLQESCRAFTINCVSGDEPTATQAIETKRPYTAIFRKGTWQL